MHDINKQTYIPGACTSHPDSPYLLVYKRKHPQTLGCIFDYVRKIISIIFSSNMHHTFLTFPFPTLYFFLSPSLISLSCFALFILLQHTTSIVSGPHNHPICKFDMFHALILLNRREIDKQYLHCLVSMLFRHLANLISIRHTLTHFTRCSLVTISFQVSCNPLSGLSESVKKKCSNYGVQVHL